MTERVARLIQIRMRNTSGWGGIVAYHPKFAAAIDALPDETGIARVNVMLRDVYTDCKAWAERTVAVAPTS